MAEKNENLRSRLISGINVVSLNPFIAHIKKNENGKCSFLTKNGLCELHSKLGIGYLCHTCKSYPRIICNVNGEVEAFLAMSCESAVRNILFNTKIMSLEKKEIDFDSIFNNELKPENYVHGKHGVDIFKIIRSASIYIIQTRKYSFWKRMIILGILIQEVDDLLVSAKERVINDEIEEAISKIIDEYLKNINKGGFEKYFSQIPENFNFKVSFTFKLFNQLNEEYQSNEAFEILNDCIYKMRDGLGIVKNGNTMLEIFQNYTDVYKRYYLPFFEDRDYVFENYVVNTLFIRGFPFNYSTRSSVYDNYLEMVVKYVLLRFLFIGMAGHYRENFGENEIVKGVIGFSRPFGHSQEIIEAIIDAMKISGMTKIGKLSMLLKN